MPKSIGTRWKEQLIIVYSKGMKKASGFIHVLLVLGSIVALTVGFLLYSFYKSESRTSYLPTEIPSPLPYINQTEDWKTYTNPHFNYSFKYPSEFSKIDEQVSAYVSISNQEGSWIEADVMYSDKPFEQFLTSDLYNKCGADGPNSMQYCDKIIERTAFQTLTSQNGIEVYLNQILEVNGKNQETKKRGPIYVFDVTPDASSQTIVLTFEIGQNNSYFPDTNNQQLIKKIAETLQID